MAQGNVEQHSVRTKGVALLQIAQRNVEWYSVRLNSIALREMAQRNVEWYSVYTNGVALCRIALQNIRRSIWTLNSLALHEIFRCCGESLCLLVGFGEIAFTSRHQKCRPQMEQWSAGGHDVIEYEDCRETITCGQRLTSPCRKAEPSEFLLFFSRRYCIHSLSFMKALIKIATRLDSTTVCRPPGLPQFACFGEPECL